MAIAAAALGDINTAVLYIKELFKISPQYQFHNGIPFVRMCDKYDDQIEHAKAKGPSYLQKITRDLSNVTVITDRGVFSASNYYVNDTTVKYLCNRVRTGVRKDSFCSLSLYPEFQFTLILRSGTNLPEKS